MSKILTDNQYYSQIADVIREQNGTSNTYTPPQMVRALKDLFYEEVEGVPPISFNGIGENLLDYRIDGASGGVGERTNNLFDEIYTNIVAGWDVKYKSIFVGEGTFTLSTTCPKQDGGSATNLFFLSGNVSTGANSGTNGVYNNYPATVTSLNGYVTIGYRAQSYDPRNYTTMLNEGTTALPYEPYGYKVSVVCGGTTTNIYLDEPIGANESISLSDTNVNIPTIRGTNVLTVDTTVQPSNVYVKARKESQYETIMRERYEEAQAQLDALESGGE